MKRKITDESIERQPSSLDSKSDESPGDASMGASLSVVIPAYNEESRIQPTLVRLSVYLPDLFRDFEIIVVDDGSLDKTASVVEDLGRKLDNIRLIHYPVNRGKGYAVRQGVLSSAGGLVLLSDADMSTPIEELEKLLPFINDGFDVAVGSRGLKESDIIVRQPWYREKIGKTFNMLVRVLGVKGFRDTQCGFKLFRGEAARRLFAKSRIDGFCFDVEILYLAQKSGRRIREVPVRWLDSPSSKVTLVRDPLAMFLDLLRIRMYWMSGRYADGN